MYYARWKIFIGLLMFYGNFTDDESESDEEEPEKESKVSYFYV